MAFARTPSRPPQGTAGANANDQTAVPTAHGSLVSGTPEGHMDREGKGDSTETAERASSRGLDRRLQRLLNLVPETRQLKPQRDSLPQLETPQRVWDAHRQGHDSHHPSQKQRGPARSRTDTPVLHQHNGHSRTQHATATRPMCHTHRFNLCWGTEGHLGTKDRPFPGKGRGPKAGAPDGGLHVLRTLGGRG